MWCECIMKKTILILTGGKSRRMGENKAFLTYNGNSFIENRLQEFRAYEERIIVTNDVEAYKFDNILTIKDIYEDKGPLCGIYTGLEKATNEVCGVVAVDSPFITSECMDYLIEKACHYDAVVPSLEGRLYPLCAAYNKSALATIREAILADERKVQKVLESLDVKKIEEEELKRFGEPQKLLRNINTPVDYLKIIT